MESKEAQIDSCPKLLKDKYNMFVLQYYSSFFQYVGGNILAIPVGGNNRVTSLWDTYVYILKPARLS